MLVMLSTEDSDHVVNSSGGGNNSVVVNVVSYDESALRTNVILTM